MINYIQIEDMQIGKPYYLNLTVNPKDKLNVYLDEFQNSLVNIDIEATKLFNNKTIIVPLLKMYLKSISTWYLRALTKNGLRWFCWHNGYDDSNLFKDKRFLEIET